MRDDRSVQGWVLYDLANVIFAMGVGALYFPLRVVDDLGGRDRHVAIASSASMLVIFVLAPMLGLAADRTNRRVRPLAVCTIITCALTATIGLGGLWWALSLFALANVTFGCGLVYYDALLPTVSTAATRGRISGYGVAAGFGGAVIAVVAGIAVLAVDGNGKPVVFAVLAVLFLLGALPCFIWVREPRRRHQEEDDARAFTPRVAFLKARAVPGMTRLLIGRGFYTDAANAMFAFMSIYAVKEVGFSDLVTELVLLVGILTGPLGALGAGRMTDGGGAKETLDRVLLLWMGVLAACALIPALNLPSMLFWIVAPLGGIAFGATGAVDRALLIELSPPEETGTYFGLFAMVGRFSAILGPALWALIADVLGLGRPMSVAALCAMAGLSLWLFRSLPDAVHEHEPPVVTEGSLIAA